VVGGFFLFIMMTFLLFLFQQTHIVDMFTRISSILIPTAIAMTVSSCSHIDYRAYYNQAVEEISSEENFGRSEFGNGDIMAAKIIIDKALEIKDLAAKGQDASYQAKAVYPPFKSEVQPCDEGRWASIEGKEKYLPYLQHLSMPMNVMRGDMAVSIDGKALKATYDFTAKEFSPTCHGEFGLKTVKDEKITEGEFVSYLNSGEFKDCFAVVSWQKYLELPANHFERYIPYLGKLDKEKIAGVIMKDSELFPYFKARSYYNLDIPVLMATDAAIPEDGKSIKVDIDAKMLPRHDGHNIIAYLPGTDPEAEQYYTFIAHYDHLGLMGRDNIYPGANDNASGAAMLLTLAKFFSENRPSHGIQFIWLDTEEENLLGAFYYCGNPTMPLDKIKFLINLDMIADNTDHLATECNEIGMSELAKIQAINSDNGGYTPFDITLQDLSDNSDHFAFDDKGVPVVYFSTEGDYYQHYHTPRDTYKNSTDENFERLFRMLTKYID